MQRYFAEAVAASRFLPELSEGGRMRALDIGSGGGSPALPLAIVQQAFVWTLVESNERRALFLEEAVRDVGLGNVGVVRARFEAWNPGERFGVVTVRGVAMDAEALTRVGGLLSAPGRLLWFSGEKRLSSARPRLEGQGWACEGPIRLVPKGGYLLVAEKCFT